MSWFPQLDEGEVKEDRGSVENNGGAGHDYVRLPMDEEVSDWALFHPRGASIFVSESCKDRVSC